MENMNESICDDCHKVIGDDFIILPACKEYHMSGIECCRKLVCKDGCNFICTQCQTINVIDLKYVDGFAVAFECYNCKGQNKLDIYFYGDPRIECERYDCCCGYHKDDGIVYGDRVESVAVTGHN